MRIMVILLSAIIFISVNIADAAIEFSVSAEDEEGNNFYFAIGDYYKVPQQDVIIIKERHIPDEEIPVVFFVAKKARVAPAAIIDLRLRGRTWMDIILHFGLSPEIFYVPLNFAKIGPPYGRIHGYYKHPKSYWRKLRLLDDDVIDLANLRFLHEYYKYPPEEVLKMRVKGKNFVAIHNNIHKEKKGPKEKLRKEIGKHKEKGVKEKTKEGIGKPKEKGKKEKIKEGKGKSKETVKKEKMKEETEKHRGKSKKED